MDDPEDIIKKFKDDIKEQEDNEDEELKYGNDNQRKKSTIIKIFFFIRISFVIIKLLMDLVNWFLIVESQYQVSFGTFLILAFYGANDLWMLGINSLPKKHREDDIIPNNIMLTWPRFQQKSWIKEAKKELKYFHQHKETYIISTYAHVFVAIGIFALSIVYEDTLKESILGQISYYLQIIGVCASIFIPTTLVAIFYIIIMIIVLLTMALDIFLFFAFFIFLIVFSPFICLHLKFAEKNQHGKTKLELRMRESYKQSECSICLEDFQLKDSIITFPCFKTHFFHKQCGLDWWLSKKSCPICRANLSHIPQQNLQITNNYEFVEREVMPDEIEKVHNIPLMTLFCRLFQKKLKKRCLKLKKDFFSLFIAQEGLILFMLISFHYMANI